MDARISTATKNQPAEVRYVCTEGPRAYDGVLSLYAMLAYPSHNEWEKRTDFVRALRALKFKRVLTQGGDRSAVPQTYRQFKNEKIVGQLNRGFRRIGWRLSAGSMAYCIALDGVRILFDAPPVDGSLGIKVSAPNTVNEAAKKLTQDNQGTSRGRNNSPDYCPEEDAINVKHRIWASSLTVLHLAVSLHVEVLRNKSNTELSGALICLSHEPTWFGPALANAEKWKQVLALKISTFVSEKAVCLLPTEDISKAYMLPPEDAQ